MLNALVLTAMLGGEAEASLPHAFPVVSTPHESITLHVPTAEIEQAALRRGPALVLGHRAADSASTLYPSRDDFPSIAPGSITLAVGSDDAEMASLQRAVTRANVLYGVGTVTAGVGVGVVSVGLVTILVGIIPAVAGNDGMLTTGVVMMAVGGGITAVGLPIVFTGSVLGGIVLRRHGVDVSLTPTWVALSGVGVAIAGSALGVGQVSSVGGAMLLGGTLVQVITSNRALKDYEQQNTVVLHPISVADGYGLGLTVRR